jgi:hydroxyethylthiazole kinase-like uncharacterized protein yjeF
VSPLGELLRSHPLPGVDGDKHDRGTLLVVGGPASCPGGALLAGTAALLVGTGRVQLAVHPDVAAAVGVALPEAWVARWDHDGDLPGDVAASAGSADAVLVGPGLHDAADVALAVAAAMAGQPLLLDAGALGAAKDIAGLAGPAMVLIPNQHEAEELGAGGSVDEAARALAADHGCVVAVRGETTAVADPGGGCWTTEAGVPGLGTAGSGDVLAGAAGGLLARGVEPVAAVAWAVALHARAGRALASPRAVGFLAREIADALPAAIEHEHRPGGLGV